MLCGFYRATPAVLGKLTVAEVLVMIDGIDWVNDRQWERLLFAKAPDRATIEDLWDLNYPHFRHERVTRIIRSDDEADSDVFPGAEVVDG